MQAHPSGHVVHARTCATRRRLGVRFALIFGDPSPVEPYMTVHAVGPSKEIRQARARGGHAESLVEPLLRKLLPRSSCGASSGDRAFGHAKIGVVVMRAEVILRRNTTQAPQDLCAVIAHVFK